MVNGTGGGGSAGRTVILNIVMQLRKCCNHPYLFAGVEDRKLDPLGDHLILNCGKVTRIFPREIYPRVSFALFCLRRWPATSEILPLERIPFLCSCTLCNRHMKKKKRKLDGSARVAAVFSFVFFCIWCTWRLPEIHSFSSLSYTILDKTRNVVHRNTCKYTMCFLGQARFECRRKRKNVNLSSNDIAVSGRQESFLSYSMFWTNMGCGSS